MLSHGRGRALRRREVVGAAQSDGGVPSVRELDDEVGIEPASDANDLDALAVEGVVRMGNGDESRRRRG